MTKSVPHFSEKWLESYNARRRATPKAPTRPEPAQSARPKAPPHAHTEIADALIDYSANSVAVPFRGYDGKQTATEKRYNAQVLGGAGRFEAVCLYLPGGGRYTPDFMTMDDGQVTFHEVKGSYRLGSQGRAHTAFQEAAAAFPMWRFVWAAERKGGGFDVKRFISSAINERDS